MAQATGLFGVPNIRNAMIQNQFAPDTRPPPAEPVKKPGLFGQGGIGRAIAGTIGDVLLQRGGNAPIYAPAMQYRQALADRQRMASLDRQNDMADWLAKQEWERANPKPASNDTVADYEFIRQNLGEEAAASFLRNKADPPVYRVGPDGQFYRVDVARPQVLGTELPAGWTIQGGTAGNGGGNFR